MSDAPDQAQHTAERLADLEAQVAALRAPRDLGPPPPPPLSDLARRVLAKQEAVRAERAKAREEELERQRREDVRLAPKRAKRDREVEALRRKIDATYAEMSALEARIGGYVVEIRELYARTP